VIRNECYFIWCEDKDGGESMLSLFGVGIEEELGWELACIT